MIVEVLDLQVLQVHQTERELLHIRKQLMRLLLSTKAVRVRDQALDRHKVMGNPNQV